MKTPKSLDLAKQLLRGADILDQGEEKFPHDRSKYMNASEAGGCIRRQWYSKKYEAGPQDWGYARRGSHGELYMVEALQAANVPLAFAGGEQESLVLEDKHIAGSPDGQIEYDDEIVPVEFKTIDPRTNVSKLPKPQHVMQLQINMELIEVMRNPSGKPITRGVILYMDASNYNLLHEFTVPRMTPQEWTAVEARADKLMKSRSDKSLDREGKRLNECKLCPFTERCGVAISNTGSTRRGNRGTGLHTAVSRLMQVKDEMSDLKAQEDELKEDVKVELHSRKVDQLEVDGVLIKLSQIKGRETLDKKAVAAAGIDLSPFTKVGQPSERLELKRL